MWRCGNAEVIRSQDPRSVLLIEGLVLSDGEPRSFQLYDDLPGQMTPTDQTFLDRLKPVLPPNDRCIRC